MLFTGTGTLKSTYQHASAVRLWLVRQEGKAEGTGGCLPTSAKGSVTVGSGSEGQVSSGRKGKTQECPLKLLLYQPASSSVQSSTENGRKIQHSQGSPHCHQVRKCKHDNTLLKPTGNNSVS